MKKLMSEKQIAANRRNARRSTGPRTQAGKSVSRLNSAKHGLLARQVVACGRLHHESVDDFKKLSREYHESLLPVGPLEEMLVGQIVTVVWRTRRARTAEAGEIAMNVDANWWSSRQTPWERGNGSRWNPLSTCMRDFRKNSRSIALIIEALEELRDAVQKTGEVSEEKLKEFKPEYAKPPNDIVAQLLEFRTRVKSTPETIPGNHLRTQFVKELLEYLEKQIAEHENLMLALQEQENAEDKTRRAAAMLPDEQVVEKFVRYENALQRQLYRAMNQLERLQRRRHGEAVPPPIVMDVSVRS